jgi:DNA-binding CsgD family transcriptional regulator
MMKRSVSITEFEHAGTRYVAIGQPAPTLAPLGQLSAAEVGVTLLWARGASMREIAVARGVALRTVTNQLGSAYRKLGASSRADIVQLLESST